jgi:hypothetical protein
MRFRHFVLASAIVLPPALAVHPTARGDLIAPAEAAVSILMSLDELVAASTYVVVGTATEHYSQWEELGGGRRIVTYTRVRVDRSVVGEPSSDVWVRTLGGAVGKIGQSVSGEAQLTIGAKSLLFLAKADAALVVTGLAQGHYPIVLDGKTERLASSPDAGALLPRRGPTIGARDVLLGTTVDEGAAFVQRARRAQDAKK